MTDAVADDTEDTGDKDILEEAKEAFDLAVDAEEENRNEALDDLRFARLGEQWSKQVVQLRGKRRPTLTINKMPAFIRQVVNDARQNKPSIKVRPVDDDADVHTAEVVNGLIRNIETISNADVAYDTACEHAVGQGFGYFRIGIEYSHDDTFDQDLLIQAIPNPFSVYGDPNSTAADSSDWNSAFICEWMPKKQFRAMYGKKQAANWDDQGYAKLQNPWSNGDQILLAEWFKREEVERKILMLSSGEVIAEDTYAQMKDILDQLGIKPGDQSRVVKSWKVKHHLLTGAEVLKSTDWAGKYIPIVPVYGDEVNVEGKRYFRSLIRDAKDPQRMVNYWRTVATELVALAPKAPWVGPESAFNGVDSKRWEDANTENYSFLSFPDKSPSPPIRQPFAGVPAGALQEALNASDDMKSVIGLYDAALGAKSNETSGIAINARAREGDVSTFHFIDNLSRAIRHGGKILIDLIPHVYTGKRIVRILGAEGQVATAQLGQRPQAPEQMPGTSPSPMPAQPPLPAGQGVPWPPKPPQAPDGSTGVFDLAMGKYDLVVDVGPSYTTRRAEAADQMMQLIKAFPQAASVIGDLVAKNLDWPGAQEIADRLHKMLPPQLQTGPDGQPLPMPAPPPDPKMVAAQGDVAAEQGRLRLEGQRIALEGAHRDKEMQLESLTKIIVAKINAGSTVEGARIKAGADLTTNVHDILGGLFSDAMGHEANAKLQANEPQEQSTGEQSGPAGAPQVNPNAPAPQVPVFIHAPMQNTELLDGLKHLADSHAQLAHAHAQGMAHHTAALVSELRRPKRVVRTPDGKIDGVE